MCGIAGLVGLPTEASRDAMPHMLEALRRRGPDDEGVWHDDGVCLGHRRLSIIDTSQAGHQPMLSVCGRYVIVVNGEIYNFRQLRAELDAAQNIAWRGHSDIEVLVETIARFGLESALRSAKGMFAFGLWDRQTRTLHLARDRLGEKPLYYAQSGKGLAFASELTALERLPSFSSDLSPAALEAFFRFGYVPAPMSIYSGARKLEPGAVLTWREGEQPAQSYYWRVADAVRAGRGERLTDCEDALERLDQTLRGVVARQMISDVPLGAFLSGGIDSSLVTAIMQSQSTTPIRTFTLGFESAEFDEAEHARAVARHIGADHTEHRVTVADAQAIAPKLGTIYDEPFADSSQIPTFMISEMARREVTVCLTGDGGDEMFGGYVRYPGVIRLWNAMGRVPARGMAASAFQALPLPFVERAAGWLGPLARQYASRGAVGPSLRKVARWLGADSREALFESTMTLWPHPHIVLGRPAGGGPEWRPEAPEFDNEIEPMLWRDAVDYLPGDILCKVDRAAMANGLETRVPFLDLDVVDLAWRVPPSMKVRGRETKLLLRKLLSRYVPPELTERPKVGFTVPLHEWLSGGLRAWARDLLAPSRLNRQGVLAAAPVEAAWRGMAAGDSSLAPQLWSVLMFQTWMEARGR
ncbi:MAG TPA: asparagine synthase (glutamine-hydrolyzing) [Caulobacteraceae bacterium]